MWHFNIYSWHVASVSPSNILCLSLSLAPCPIVIQLNRRWMTKRINSVRVNYPFACGAFSPLCYELLLTVWIYRGGSASLSQIHITANGISTSLPTRRWMVREVNFDDGGCWEKMYLFWLASGRECIIAWMGTLFFFTLPSSLLAHATNETDEREMHKRSRTRVTEAMGAAMPYWKKTTCSVARSRPLKMDGITKLLHL